MLKFLIPYLALINGLWVLVACASPYKHFQKTGGDMHCISKFKPVFSTAYYDTRVELLTYSFSGILIMKTMPDSNLRLVFATKPGIKFFDFSFSSNGEFKILYIMDQLDRKAVIKTLRKDFELLLQLHTDSTQGYILSGNGNHYFTFPQGKGINYYITDSSCNQLISMERASKTKIIAEALVWEDQPGKADSVRIEHKNFHFTIDMKRMNPDAQR